MLHRLAGRLTAIRHCRLYRPVRDYEFGKGLAAADTFVDSAAQVYFILQALYCQKLCTLCNNYPCIITIAQIYNVDISSRSASILLYFICALITSVDF